ncbi:MAG: YbaB/EbfC family nucleoid-associated protein [Pseudomonadota bacterium]
MKLADMMQQAQEMQQKMQTMQDELNEREVTGEAGGGLVKISMSAKGQLHKINIDPELMKQSQINILEDLIVAAFNQAHSKGKQLVEDETKRMMTNMGLPPNIKLPL